MKKNAPGWPVRSFLLCGMCDRWGGYLDSLSAGLAGWETRGLWGSLGSVGVVAVQAAAAAAADAGALREAAHRLKSASGALGAMRVHALARDIENVARGGYACFDPSDRLELEQALQDTFDMLETLGAALPSGANESACRAD